MYDIFVICVILMGALSGLYTLHCNRDYFKEFSNEDFFNGRIDSWLYVSNSISTAACIVDVVLQTTWFLKGGCPYCDPDWLVFWLTYHLVIAVNAILIHVTTNNLLQKTEFCNLCKRKYDFEQRPK